jgi:hypothetical protein
LTASYGGRQDHLIEANGLKHVIVFNDITSFPEGLPIDTNDDYARMPEINFALKDNHVKK